MIQRYDLTWGNDGTIVESEYGSFPWTTGDWVKFSDLPKWKPILEAVKDDKTKILRVEGFEPCMGMWLESHQQWIDFDPESFDTIGELNERMQGYRYEPTHFITLEELMRVVGC